MSTESVQFTVRERFAAPLPEFYQRRIIFWQDEDREFESTLDELNLPGVNIVKLTGTNNFAVKKLLLHDDLTGNYLIYNPFSYASPQDNWLRDIELYSEEFRADYYSILMSELNIHASPVMRRTVKLYATFFDNKERVAKLRKIDGNIKPRCSSISTLWLSSPVFPADRRRMSSLRCFPPDWMRKAMMS